MALYLGGSNTNAVKLLSSDGYALTDSNSSYLTAPSITDMIRKRKVYLNGVVYKVNIYTPKKEDE